MLQHAASLSTVTPYGATIRLATRGERWRLRPRRGRRGAGRQTEAITYDDLYRRWEEGNWKAYDLDFSKDRKGWQALSEIQRKSALWIYSMFFFGEDSVTDNLSPYIDAAPTEEQKYFLATQQVDEARHAVFFPASSTR